MNVIVVMQLSQSYTELHSGQQEEQSAALSHGNKNIQKSIALSNRGHPGEPGMHSQWANTEDDHTLLKQITDE